MRGQASAAKKAGKKKQATSGRAIGRGHATARGKATGKSKRRWIQGVKTVSTFPPAGLFTMSAPVIARTLASPKVSPKGPSSGMRMLNYFVNRAGKGLSASRKRELERAKHLLSERIKSHKSAA